MAITAVVRELLVRYLDVWTPAALRSAKRVTFAYAWAGPSDSAAHTDTVEASLRGVAEFNDLLRARRLTYVVVGPDPRVTAGLDRLQADVRTPANLAVHAVTGPPESLLLPALAAAGAAGAPVLLFVDGWPPPDLHRTGRPTELIAIGPAGESTQRRDALREQGFTLTTAVELVDGSDAVLVTFATDRATSLEAFKNELWSVDEYAGVRFRDPDDPQRHLLDISLEPHPGPLRRALLARLAAAGPQTVTQLRHYALTDTVYRSADATRVLAALRHSGTIAIGAERGRLSGDAVVTPV
jgi:hypothetical protein